MVKGEHLRPLAGFVVVCGIAALILATGLTDPAALRRIVSEPRVLPSPSLTELVLGRTFDPAPVQATRRPAAETAPEAAPEVQASLVSASSAQAAARSHHASHAAHAGPAVAPSTHVASVQPAQASPAVTEASEAEPVSTPAPTTPTTPASSTTPVRGVIATSGTHQSTQASAVGDSSGGHAHHHAWGHSRGGEDRHQAHGRDDRHQTHQVRQAHAGPSAFAPTSSVADSADLTAVAGSPHAHDHGDHAHDNGDHSHDDHSHDDHSHDDHSHGHGHGHDHEDAATHGVG